MASLRYLQIHILCSIIPHGIESNNYSNGGIIQCITVCNLRGLMTLSAVYQITYLYTMTCSVDKVIHCQ